MYYNILQVGDIKEHTEDSTCDCCPEVEINKNGNILIIHHSWDGREILEEANKILNK